MSRRDDPLDGEFVNMQYFTPELVLNLNSSDGDVVDEAMARWEKAVDSYQKHLRKLRNEMPEELQPITHLSLHDWKLVKLWHGPGRRGGSVMLVLQNGEDMFVLSYRLSDKLRRSNAPEGWSSEAGHVEWLYDEVDFDTENQKSYIHRVLFSDGTILALPFSQCSVLPVHSGRAVSPSELMQIA